MPIYILIALFTMEQKKIEKELNGENVKITKRSHAYKCYASNYRVEILNSLNPELNFSNIESAIQNKPINLLNKPKGLKIWQH